jgi:hypothetical protein
MNGLGYREACVETHEQAERLVQGKDPPSMNGLHSAAGRDMEGPCSTPHKAKDRPESQ